MKVVLCLHHFFPEVIGGTEMYCLRLAQHLQLTGIEALIIIPNLGEAHTVEYTYEEIKVIKYAENSIEDRQMIMGKRPPGGLTEFLQVIRREKPDVIHFHELAPGRGINIFHVEKVRAMNIPIVLTFHLAAYSCYRGSLVYKDVVKCDGIIRIKRCTECAYQFKNITGIKAKLLSASALSLYKIGVDATNMNNTIGTALGFPYVIAKIKNDLLKLTHLADKIIVLAEWYRDILIKNEVPSEKIVFIKQGLTQEFPAPPTKKKITLPLKVVFLGRINSLKGLHLILQAFSKLPQHKISLHIYGQETDPEYARACRQQSQSNSNIKWMGTLPSENVIDTLSEFHLLCLPSTFSEMSPLVIQEAFAAGVPVLASDVYGNAEQITDGINGWLFRFKDSDSLLQKFNMLLDNLHMVESAGHQLLPSHLFDTVAEKHVELYSDIVNSRVLNPVG